MLLLCFYMAALSDLIASYWFNHTGQPSCTQTALAQSPPSRLCALPAHDTRRHAGNPSPDGATTVAAEADASSVNVRPEASFSSSPSFGIPTVLSSTASSRNVSASYSMLRALPSSLKSARRFRQLPLLHELDLLCL